MAEYTCVMLFCKLFIMIDKNKKNIIENDKIDLKYQILAYLGFMVAGFKQDKLLYKQTTKYIKRALREYSPMAIY